MKMLADPKFLSYRNKDSVMMTAQQVVNGTSPGKNILEKLDLGMYLCQGWNIEYDVEAGQIIEVYPALGEVIRRVINGNHHSFGTFGSYGVCDFPYQVIQKCPELAEDPNRRFFISFVKLEKEEQCPKGGWRWHKWGPYIGTQEPQCEYLYDEPVIKTVYTYRIYELASK